MTVTNHTPIIDVATSTTGCCALIDPEQWDQQSFTFDDKLFAQVRTRGIFHIPINMDKVMRTAQAKIDAADARPNEFLMLSSEVSPWTAEHLLAVSRPVRGLEMVRVSGLFLTKVFEGPFKDASRWNDELVGHAESRGKTPLKTYFFYTTCPRCAKRYGKNYVVGFEQVADVREVVRKP